MRTHKQRRPGRPKKPALGLEPKDWPLIDRVHYKWLLWAFRQTKGHRQSAADLLGITRQTVLNWERRYGLLGPGPAEPILVGGACKKKNPR